VSGRNTKDPSTVALYSRQIPRLAAILDGLLTESEEQRRQSGCLLTERAWFLVFQKIIRSVHVVNPENGAIVRIKNEDDMARPDASGVLRVGQIIAEEIVNSIPDRASRGLVQFFLACNVPSQPVTPELGPRNYEYTALTEDFITMAALTAALRLAVYRESYLGQDVVDSSAHQAHWREAAIRASADLADALVNNEMCTANYAGDIPVTVAIKCSQTRSEHAGSNQHRNAAVDVLSRANNNNVLRKLTTFIRTAYHAIRGTSRCAQWPGCFEGSVENRAFTDRRVTVLLEQLQVLPSLVLYAKRALLMRRLWTRLQTYPHRRTSAFTDPGHRDG
jgi:hypothetical protein